MSTPSWMQGHPRKILLATDLSARCDRALDRAVSLAERWGAGLVVMHALDSPESGASDQAERLPSWRQPPDPLSVARRRLLADVGAVAEKATIVIEVGDPAEAILRTAAAESCDLIVTGIARDEPFGRLVLGRTVDRLLRRSREPLLVVKHRAQRPYHHVVVATDFSNSSRHALEAALRFFPGQDLTLFHAYEAPLAALAGLAGDPSAYQQEYGRAAARECETFLESVDKPAGGWHPQKVLIEYGAADRLLHDYVRDNDVDLVVLGTHGRSALFEVLLGSVAKRIMDGLPCDALVVREPRAAVKG